MLCRHGLLLPWRIIAYHEEEVIDYIKGCQYLLSDADPELFPFVVLVPMQGEIIPFRKSPSTDGSVREVICSHFHGETKRKSSGSARQATFD
jgi:hypothetical protein